MVEITKEIANKIKGKEYKENTLFNTIEFDGAYYVSEVEALCLSDFGFDYQSEEKGIEKKSK